MKLEKISIQGNLICFSDRKSFTESDGFRIIQEYWTEKENIGHFQSKNLHYFSVTDSKSDLLLCLIRFFMNHSLLT